MTTQNATASSDQVNGEVKEKRKAVAIVEYATREECENNRPEGADAKKKDGSDSWEVYQVTRPNGDVTFIWGVGAVNAASTVARIDGYQVSKGTGRGPRKTSPVAAMASLSALTDEQATALGLSADVLASIRQAAKGNTPAAAVLHTAPAAASQAATPSRRSRR